MDVYGSLKVQMKIFLEPAILKKNNDEDTNENQTAIKNDNMCEGLISWRFAGDWSEEMQRIYEKKNDWKNTARANQNYVWS